MSISLLINTFDRYDNLKRILEVESQYDCIDEILIFNNGNQDIEISNPKIKVIKATYDVGLRSRWILGALAENKCLFVQDDDLLVSESIFKMLYGHFLFDESRVYSIFGRKVEFDNYYDFNKWAFGEVDIALTRLACFPKMLIPHILESEERILPYRYPKGKEFPHDDIVLSFTCLGVFNKKPLCVKYMGADGSGVEEMDTNNQLHDDPGFLNKRADIIKKCKKLLCYEHTHDFITDSTYDSDEIILPPI